MLSSRGAITTNVAMVECAGGQNTRGKEVFLLSELEKVWVAVSILVRRHLLEGHNVQIANLGSFWLEERCLINDTTRYRQRFNIHQLKFGVNSNFSLRYGMDSVKAPLEKPNLSYVKIHMADVVNICAVPAQTAAMALKEFIMYLGEGLYCGRTFQLSFPGVATLIVKRERFMLTADSELNSDLFDTDSRKWPVEMQARGREKLAEEQASSSVSSTRPSSRASRHSRPSTAASASVSVVSSTPRAAFNPAAPKDRLFADIEKEATRRRVAEQHRRQAELETARRQERVDRMIDAYDCYAVDEDGDLTDVSGHPSPQQEVGRTITYRPATRESVYDWAADPPEAEAAATRQAVPRGAKEARGTPAEEPEVEVIEVTAEEKEEPTAAAPAPTARAPRSKDPLLEAILRQEEVFSRPASRHRGGVAHCSVRDLLYASASSAAATQSETAARSGRPVTRTRRHDPQTDAIAVPPQHASFTPVGDAGSGPQFGRKRHAEYYGTSDTVGDLLKLPAGAS